MTTHPREVLDLGLELCCGMLAHGASVSSAIRTTRQAMHSWGLADLQVDVTQNTVIISVREHWDADPITAMRVVPIGHQDFGRIAQLQHVADRAARRGVDASRQHIERILLRPARWGGRDVSLGFGLVSGAAAWMLGAPVIVGLLALVVAWTIHRAQVWLAARRVSLFFQQVVGGAIAALVASTFAWGKGLGLPGVELIDPGLIVIGAIISMLAGLAILGASEDAISGLYVTGTAHALQGLIATIGLVVGASTVVAAANLAGIRFDIDIDFPLPELAPVTVGCAGIVAGAWAFCTRTSRGVTVLAGAIGALGWAVFLWLGQQAWPTVAATGMTALVIGLVSALSARVLKVQLDSVSTAAVVPVLPGLVTWAGVVKVALGSGTSTFLDGQQDLMTAAAIGVVLAAGVAAGAALARPVSVPVRRLTWPIRMARKG